MCVNSANKLFTCHFFEIGSLGTKIDAMASRIADFWRRSLQKHPVITNTAAYATFYTAAELSQQSFYKYNSPEKVDMDFKSAGRIVAVGSTVYAPTLYFWYKLLDKKFPGKALKAVATKVASDQFIMTPILLATFYTLIGVLERKEDVFKELRDKYWRTFIANQAFWIPAQTVNFFFIPPHLRVVYVASTSFLWINVLCFIKRQKFKLRKFDLPNIRIKLWRLIQIISLLLLTLILPFIAVLITIALLYKVVCSVAIRRKDKRFVKFLDSFDVFCCLEDNVTTDIQGVVKSNTVELAVDNIKDKLHKVFTNHGADKIFYRRNEDYGFYYWRRYSFIDLAQYVQIVEVSETHNENNEGNLEQVQIANEILSYNDEGLFKVLIMKKNHEDDDGIDEYKIVMKFHHSIKDTALIEFIARLVEETNDCHVTLVSTRESQDYSSPDAIMNMITKLLSMLARSFDDSAYRTNRLQDVSFIRMKTLEWTKSDENLLSKVKGVKDNVCDLCLSDIFRYFLNREIV